MRRIAIVAILVIAIIAVSAGAVYYNSIYMPPVGSSPTVSILSPASGAVVSNTFTVTVSTSNFNIPTQGHIHVYLDSINTYQFGNGPTFTFTNVAPGLHTIWAQLQNPDHSPLSPPVETQPITINVAAPAASPTVSITSPSNGAEVSDSFTVTMASTNFNIPTQGHYHVYLDNLASTEKMAYSQVSTVAFNDVSPGMHTVTVRLANPDHTDVQPSVSQTITVNVEQSGGGPSPAIFIASPTNGATVQGPAVTVTVSAANFNIPARGHIHVYLDGQSYIMGNGPTFTFPNVLPGTHTITADLRNPDHTPLSPSVSLTRTITVLAGSTGGSGGGGGYGY